MKINKGSGETRNEIGRFHGMGYVTGVFSESRWYPLQNTHCGVKWTEIDQQKMRNLVKR